MIILDLFSGIGGFSLGLERAGFKTAAFCEIDQFCRKILAQNWPEVPIYNDICELNGNALMEALGSKIEVITGGFPCQDLSCAGQQKGMDENTRSGLWWEMRRIISEVRPKFAIMENVSNFLSGKRGVWFGNFLASLAEIGYDAQWTCIPAAAAGMPHCRERVWVISYPSRLGWRMDIFKKIDMSKALYKSSQNKKNAVLVADLERSYPAIPEYLRVDDGVSVELDEVKNRISACGNSIVPEIVYQIGRLINGLA